MVVASEIFLAFYSKVKIIEIFKRVDLKAGKQQSSMGVILICGEQLFFSSALNLCKLNAVVLLNEGKTGPL